MATVKPFCGLRPPKNLVEKIESRPYDVLDSDEARKEAGDNEMSLYHIIKPEINPSMTHASTRAQPSNFKNSKTRAGSSRTRKLTIIFMRKP